MPSKVVKGALVEVAMVILLVVFREATIMVLLMCRSMVAATWPAAASKYLARRSERKPRPDSASWWVSGSLYHTAEPLPKEPLKRRSWEAAAAANPRTSSRSHKPTTYSLPPARGPRGGEKPGNTWFPGGSTWYFAAPGNPARSDTPKCRSLPCGKGGS